METPTSKGPLAALVAAGVLVVGLIVAFASGVFKSNPQQTPTPTPTDTTSASPSQTPTSKYKDGTYNTHGSYRSPGGQEQFELSVTLKNDVIVATTFTPKPVSPTGVKKQAAFNTAYKEQVVGKNIDSISLGVVNGASLTTGGFMNALQTIKAKAQA